MRWQQFKNLNNKQVPINFTKINRQTYSQHTMAQVAQFSFKFCHTRHRSSMTSLQLGQFVCQYLDNTMRDVIQITSHPGNHRGSIFRQQLLQIHLKQPVNKECGLSVRKRRSNKGCAEWDNEQMRKQAVKHIK